MTAGFASALASRFGDERVRAHVPLAPFTTFRVGGPADVFLEPRGSSEMLDAVRIAHSFRVPVTLLGGGSNVLVSDRGVRGVVLRARQGEVIRTAPDLVRADAAVSINGLVRWCITHACAGLEAWAGTPGTVGGAIYGNAHYGGELIGSLITEIDLTDLAGRVRTVSAGEMDFGYDRSRLQRSHEIVLTAAFRVVEGQPGRMRATARQSLEHRKRTQPLNVPSAGCIFQNPDPATTELPPDVPCSAGALIDRAGLKGATLGGAAVSDVHANFIVNPGSARASDIRALIERCRASVRARFGVDLLDEIVFLGEW